MSKLMTTAAGKKRCVTCRKDKATLRCGGCLQEFCINHSAYHRQEMSRLLDEVDVSRDIFRQTLNEQTTDPQKHALIQKINDWECDSIKKIQQTAEDERQKLLKYTTENIQQIEINSNMLTKQLQQKREEKDFYETDLDNWDQELTRLVRERDKLSNINLRQDVIPLINKISVDLTSG